MTCDWVNVRIMIGSSEVNLLPLHRFFGANPRNCANITSFLNGVDLFGTLSWKNTDGSYIEVVDGSYVIDKNDCYFHLDHRCSERIKLQQQVLKMKKHASRQEFVKNANIEWDCAVAQYIVKTCGPDVLNLKTVTFSESPIVHHIICSEGLIIVLDDDKKGAESDRSLDSELTNDSASLQVDSDVQQSESTLYHSFSDRHSKEQHSNYVSTPLKGVLKMRRHGDALTNVDGASDTADTEEHILNRNTTHNSRLGCSSNRVLTPCRVIQSRTILSPSDTAWRTGTTSTRVTASSNVSSKFRTIQTSGERNSFKIWGSNPRSTVNRVQEVACLGAAKALNWQVSESNVGSEQNKPSTSSSIHQKFVFGYGRSNLSSSLPSTTQLPFTVKYFPPSATPLQWKTPFFDTSVTKRTADTAWGVNAGTEVSVKMQRLFIPVDKEHDSVSLLSSPQRVAFDSKMRGSKDSTWVSVAPTEGCTFRYSASCVRINTLI